MTATAEGMVRIYASDPSETVKNLIWEGRTETLDVSTDPRQQVQVAKHMQRLPQDWKLFIEMKADSSTFVDSTSTTIRVPVRIMTLATKMIRDADLVASDFGLTATDVTINTTFTRMGTQYTVNAGEVLSVGKQDYNNSQLYMNLTYT